MRSKILDYIPLGVICIVAFLLRTIGQWDKVFVDGNVWYRGVDAWYHMRLVDAMMENFPTPLRADIYAQYPNGAVVNYFPFAHWIIAGIGQVLNYEVVGALLPPVVGALTLVSVYFICKTLFSKAVGLLACILMAALPGEFFHRSLLGFMDHHILETFLMVTTLLFLLLDHKHNRWVYRVPAGLFLGFYLMNWAGGAFFLLILGIWVWLEVLLDRLTLHHVKMVSVPAGIAIAMSYAFTNNLAITASLFLALGPIVVFQWRRLFKNRWLTFIPSLIAPCLLIWYYQGPVRDVFWGGATYIAEASPISLTVLIRAYGVSLFLAAVGAFLYIKHKGNPLFLTWAIILVAITIGQRRWGYYTTAPIAIFSSYLVFYVVEYVKKEARAVTVVMISFFLLVPMINQISRIASLPNNIQPVWYNTLTWLKNNTPEPLPSGSYYKLKPECRPEYGVLAWWDYGHWIIRISQRVPATSPTWSHWTPARFFTAQSTELAMEVIQDVNYKYVIIDYSLLTGKWYAVVERAGYPSSMEQELLPNSMLARLWTGPVPGLPLIYRDGPIMVFEIIQP